MWGRSVLLLWSMEAGGEEVGVQLLLLQEDGRRGMAMVWKAGVGVKPIALTMTERRMCFCDELPHSLDYHSRTSLFFNAVMTTLTKSIYCSGQFPAQTSLQDDPVSGLCGFCQICHLVFTVVSPHPNVFRALGIWLSFFFQKLICNYAAPCVRLSQHA